MTDIMKKGGMPKPPPELVERFDATIAAYPDVARRPMFGQPAAFVNGLMATGLFGPDWNVRLPEDAQAELLGQGGRPFEPMAGRPMRGYLLFPSDWLDDPDRLRPWLERAFAYTASLPSKGSKPRTKR